MIDEVTDNINFTIGTMYGGYTGKGYAKDNNVSINSIWIYDGDLHLFVRDRIIGGNGEYATGNSVLISSGEVTSLDNYGFIVGGMSYGSDENGLAYGNMVSLRCVITGDIEVAGGYSFNADSNHNYVWVQKEGSVRTGRTIFGGWTSGGDSNDNHVVIDGNVDADIYGGFGAYNANKNTVTINHEYTCGKFIQGASASLETTDNTVSIENALSDTMNVVASRIWGGDNKNFSGNTLMIKGDCHINTNSIANFENYIFEFKKLTSLQQNLIFVSSGTATDLANTKFKFVIDSSIKEIDAVVISNANGIDTSGIYVSAVDENGTEILRFSENVHHFCPTHRVPGRPS